jgi:V8-like Glu-specific endopeptidase
MGLSDYECSGAVVTDTRANYSLVLTAAHCAYDQELKQFATNWIFIPAYDSTPNFTNCSNALYGCWTANALVLHAGFANESGLTTAAAKKDWAFAIVGSGGKESTQLDVAVGSFQIAINSMSVRSKVAAFGYPAASPYSGEDLVYCAGKIGEDRYTGRATWQLPCEMTGGSSGGPWISGYSATGGLITSVNSYGYWGGSDMFGPKFVEATQITFTTADSAVVNTIVP